MENTFLEITENRRIAKDVFLMRLEGKLTDVPRPGQFINIKVPDHYLRRPISVCDASEDSVTVIYKVVGHGTEYLSGLSLGIELDILSGLGNGYDLSAAGKTPLLLGGGAGVPPMYYLAKELLPLCEKVHVVLGFNTEEEIFFEDEFRALGADVSVTTVDGSYGIRGFVTDALPDGYSYFYTCGPGPMLKAVYSKTVTSGEFSFEERMGCGFGACMGCSCRTITGYKRICKDGPVLKKEEILWEA